jgi:restriction system protein
MKGYRRVMLGAKSVHADECYKGNFIGADFDIHEDLSPHLYDNWRDFNRYYIPIWMKKFPDKSKVSAGLSCGALWTIAKGLQIGDIVLCPNGSGAYYVGEVKGHYAYNDGEVLPHRRPVTWQPVIVQRSDMSSGLRNSTGSIGTVSDISKHAAEIEGFINTVTKPTIVATDDSIEDVATFALEKYLEEFLIDNWKQTELGKLYDIYEEDGIPARQFQTDTGPIDILAVSKDKKELLVVELKKGRASDSVVGQIQRYMGYVVELLAEKNQKVKGAIIALEDDVKIKRALIVAKDIEFYRYKVSFRLFKG